MTLRKAANVLFIAFTLCPVMGIGYNFGDLTPELRRSIQVHRYLMHKDDESVRKSDVLEEKSDNDTILDEDNVWGRMNSRAWGVGSDKNG